MSTSFYAWETQYEPKKGAVGMREIKFRGKSVLPIEELDQLEIKHENGWVTGNLITNAGNPLIVGDLADWGEEFIAHEYWVKVIPATVGQYTGVKDKEGVEIYDKHVVRYGRIYLVKWSKTYCGFRLFLQDGSSTPLNPYHSKDYKITGTMHGYPESLEVTN